MWFLAVWQSMQTEIHANGNKTPILDRQIHIPSATPVCSGVVMGKKYDQLDVDER
jgi:hypothetical protein